LLSGAVIIGAFGYTHAVQAEPEQGSLLRFLGFILSRLRGGVVRPRAHQRGLTLLEGLLSVGVIAAGLAIVTTLQVNQFQYEKAAVAAQQLRIVHYAARRYVRDKLGELLAEASTAARMAELSPATLAKEGYVPDFMVDQGVLTLNPYKQSYRLLVRRTDDGQKGPPTLELLTVTVGGDTPSQTAAGRVVSVAGAEAGTLSLDGQRLNGAYGSWEIPLSELPGQYRIQRGSLVMLAYFRQGKGAYVNSYAVNIPSRRDQFEELPTTEDIVRNNTPSPSASAQVIRDRNRQAANTANNSRDGYSGSFARAFNEDLFSDRERYNSWRDTPPRQVAAAPAPPPQPVQAAPRPAPSVESDNTAAAAGSKCNPERSLAISTDNRNQVLVCQTGNWQPVNLPLALHYAGLNVAAPIVTSQPFTLNQRGYLIADAAIGPVRGESRISLTSGAGIQINGSTCNSAIPGQNGILDGQFRCVQILQPGQYVVSADDGSNGTAQRSYNRLSFVVLPY
jgi:type II secretory pathway pseudopilin PulG